MTKRLRIRQYELHHNVLLYLSECIWEEMGPGPQVIKLFFIFNSAEHEIVLLINLKLLTIANSFLLNIAEHENFSANKYENANSCWHFQIY